MDVTFESAVFTQKSRRILVVDGSIDKACPHVGKIKREYVVVNTLTDAEAVAVGRYAKSGSVSFF